MLPLKSEDLIPVAKVIVSLINELGALISKYESFPATSEQDANTMRLASDAMKEELEQAQEFASRFLLLGMILSASEELQSKMAAQNTADAVQS